MADPNSNAAAAAPATAPATAAVTTSTPASLPADASDADRLAHVRAHWAGIEPKSPIYGLFFGQIRLVSARNGRVLARLPIAPIHVNSKQILHGAVSGALVDWAGGMAIASTGRANTGVSVDIHISYVGAARAGDELEIEAWVQRAGRTLAYTSVEIRKRLTDSETADETLPTAGAVVASGSHTKYLSFTGPK